MTGSAVVVIIVVVISGILWVLGKIGELVADAQRAAEMQERARRQEAQRRGGARPAPAPSHAPAPEGATPLDQMLRDMGIIPGPTAPPPVKRPAPPPAPAPVRRLEAAPDEEEEERLDAQRRREARRHAEAEKRALANETENFGGKLGGHHLETSHVGERLQERQLSSNFKPARAGARRLTDGDVETESEKPSPLETLDALPLAQRAFVLSEIFQNPRLKQRRGRR